MNYINKGKNDINISKTENELALDLKGHITQNFGKFSSHLIFRTCFFQYDGHPIYKSADQRNEWEPHVGR
jgi:hypothetical protein